MKDNLQDSLIAVKKFTKQMGLGDCIEALQFLFLEYFTTDHCILEGIYYLLIFGNKKNNEFYFKN